MTKQKSAVESGIAWALVEVLDGVKRHDLQGQTGCDQETCNKIWAAYDAAVALLKKS